MKDPGFKTLIETIALSTGSIFEYEPEDIEVREKLAEELEKEVDDLPKEIDESDDEELFN